MQPRPHRFCHSIYFRICAGYDGVVVITHDTRYGKWQYHFPIIRYRAYTAFILDDQIDGPRQIFVCDARGYNIVTVVGHAGGDCSFFQAKILNKGDCRYFVFITADNRQLENGDWDITSTTAAGSGAGGLQLAGGLYAASGVYTDKGSASLAGYFYDSGSFVSILDGVYGISTNEEINVNSNDIKIITTGDYFHLGNQGVTDSENGVSGGLVIDSSIVGTTSYLNLAAGGY